jgi:hypothetical protein
MPRWTNGTKTFRSAQEAPAERQKLLADYDSDHEGHRTKPPRVPKVRKAKREDSFSDEDATLIPLGSVSRPPKPLPMSDQSIEVRQGVYVYVHLIAVCARQVRD